MPRREPQPPEIVKMSGGSLTAAAVRLTHTRNGKTKKMPRPQPWYRTGWHFFDTVGEFRYACTWVGNLLSRAELEVWENGKLSKNADAIAAMKAFFGGVEGQREMLRQVGTHMTVPGDVYLVGESAGEDPDEWSVVSATRLTNQGRTETDEGTWKVGDKVLDDPLVIRLWRPHPEKQEQADSPTRAVLPILTELENLTKMIASQISSRLSGAGVFLIPNEMTFGSARGVATNGDGTDGGATDTGLDAFLVEFMETIMASIEDPSDPAARVPILLQGPGEHLDKIKLVTIWSELQEQASTLRSELIRRLALGMDMPPEILTGSGELNHWNAWQVEEASIKAHTEPLLQIITAAITERYLRPYLIDTGMSEEDARNFVVHADTTKIRLRPNRSKEALELYDHGILSEEATARENGFDPADMMTPKERVEFFTRKVAGGSTTPDLVALALNLLGVPIPLSQLTVQETTEAPSTPSLAEHPERAIPDVQDADFAAANVVVFRALEKVGAKLRTKYASSLVAGADSIANDSLYRYAKVSEAQFDDLLAGAWECVSTLGIQASPVALDAYVRMLLTTNKPHSKHRLTEYLREAA